MKHARGTSAMGRPRTIQINSFFSEIMESQECATIQELSLKTGLPYMTLKNWATIRADHPTFNALLRASDALEITVEDLIRGLLAAASDEHREAI